MCPKLDSDSKVKDTKCSEECVILKMKTEQQRLLRHGRITRLFEEKKNGLVCFGLDFFPVGILNQVALRTSFLSAHRLTFVALVLTNATKCSRTECAFMLFCFLLAGFVDFLFFLFFVVALYSWMRTQKEDLPLRQCLRLAGAISPSTDSFRSCTNSHPAYPPPLLRPRRRPLSQSSVTERGPQRRAARSSGGRPFT